MISPVRWFFMIAILSAGCATTPPQKPTYDDGYRAGASICAQAMNDAQQYIDAGKKHVADLGRRLEQCLEADAKNGNGK